MIWYPYQCNTRSQSYPKVHYAQGSLLHTDHGVLIDSVSGWWSVIHGYNHPFLNAALHDQIEKFSHVMLAGLCHDPVAQLTNKLEDWLPQDLNYPFYSDSGSVAVEVAYKMAKGYHKAKGQRRTKTLCLQNAYHGDTQLTMQLSNDPQYHGKLSNPDFIHIPTTLDHLNGAFERYGQDLNAMIVEPLLQGAGGMLIYPLAFLQRARELCDQFDVPLIFDEVATGFGRTGHRFVSDLVCPDILALGKGLTAGYLGHAATVANTKIFSALNDGNPEHALMHGPTFMANPLACRVALASIELFETNHTLQRTHHIQEFCQRFFDGFHSPNVKEIRIIGSCVCMEMIDQSMVQGYVEFARKKGVFARPFKKFIYAMIPSIIDDPSLEKILQTMVEWSN